MIRAMVYKNRNTGYWEAAVYERISASTKVRFLSRPERCVSYTQGESFFEAQYAVQEWRFERAMENARFG